MAVPLAAGRVLHGYATSDYVFLVLAADHLLNK